MASSRADDVEFRRACEAAIDGSRGVQKVVLAICVAKSHGVWGNAGELGRNVKKPRVLAITVNQKGQRTKAFLRVLKYSCPGVLEPSKSFKLKHLSEVEIMQTDPSGCTFKLDFDDLRSQNVVSLQWKTRNKDDRNHALICIFNTSKQILGCLPKVVGIDIVEMALWAKENTSTETDQANTEGGQSTSLISQNKSQVTVEIDLISQAEREEMESLLGIYVEGIGEAEALSERLKRELLALEAANVHAFFESEPVIEEALQCLDSTVMYVEDMDVWLNIFIVKLRHMIEDIESIESRNNKVESQSASDKLLIQELDKLLERFQIPAEFEACLTGGTFNEANMAKNIEACEWLTCALKNVEASSLDPSYAKARAVKEKLAELVVMKCTFVRRASEFLRNYFPGLTDCMLNDKHHFSQKGQLRRPDHSDFRYKCRTYGRLVQLMKSLDKNCLGPLRKAYCNSLNLLLRREAREFAKDLRLSVKVRNVPIDWLEGPLRQTTGTADSSSVLESYSKMLTVFIPFLVDESSFFTHLMCFDVSVPSQPEDPSASDKAYSVNNDSTEGSQTKHVQQCTDFSELGELNECIRDLLDGIQEDFFSVIDWAYKIDPLSCISMHGITKRYLSSQKADTASFVHLLLDDLERRISLQFSRFINDACYQIEKYEHNVRQMRVLPYISRFVVFATCMEQYVQGQARDLIDHAYTKLVSVMFVSLERTAYIDPTDANIVLLENYAVFQNSTYDLAKLVPTLAKFYYQASESYEQACLRHINMVIYINFEELFLLARKIENIILTMPSEESLWEIGISKVELQMTLKSNLELDKAFNAMYRKFQKDLTTEELLLPLWDKFKKEFLCKYRSFVELVAKIYPRETIPSVEEVKDVLLCSCT